jgi:type I restriction enzyme S subunit
MPSGWRVSDFDECVGRIRSGKSVNSFDEPVKGNEVGVLKTSSVYNGYFSPAENKRVVPGEIALVKLPVTAGTVVVSRMNSASLVGASGLVKKDAPNLYLPDRLWEVTTRPGIDPRWFAYLAGSPGVRRRLSDNASGTSASMKNISQETFLSMPALIPPLAEQRKIAEILGSWDEAIERLTLLRTAKRRRRTWYRTHVFTGRNRLSGFSGEWRRVQLSEVLTEHKNRSSGSEHVFSVSVHKGLVNQIEHLGRSFSAKDTAHYNKVSPGDIVYTKSPTGDFPLGIVKQSTIEHPVIVSPLYGVFSPVTRDLGVILDAYFESPVTLGNYLSPLVQKGAKNTIAITNSRFLEGHLVLPIDPAEQSAIARVIEAYQYELARIDAEITALNQQKRGLMQKLLTGQWRVNVGDTT